jgi:YggT family protein
VIAWTIVAYVLLLFLLLLIARMIHGWVQVFARDFRPSGPAVLFLELIYTATDPPLKALRRVIPPLRVGQMSIDLSFLVVFIVVAYLYQFAAARG